PFANVCTFNERTLLPDAQLIELEEEARQIKFDVIGLAEVRRKKMGPSVTLMVTISTLAVVTPILRVDSASM
ncbi:hypothetical protein AB6A40_009248, partial [Gnathostoma spinigerum]